jgi:hypothetical protein
MKTAVRTQQKYKGLLFFKIEDLTLRMFQASGKAKYIRGRGQVSDRWRRQRKSSEREVCPGAVLLG